MKDESTRELAIEELEEQYKKIAEEYDTLGKQLKERKRKEAELKEAALKSEQETRKKEIDDAFNKYKTLLSTYVKDYGSYSTSTSESFKDINPTILTNPFFWWF